MQLVRLASRNSVSQPIFSGDLLNLGRASGQWTGAGTSSAREPLAGQRQANEERAMGQRTSQLRPTSRCDVITVASTKPAAHSHRLVTVPPSILLIADE